MEEDEDMKATRAARDELLIRQLRCQQNWPICLFDFTVTKTVHDFFVFKAEAPR